MKHTLAVLCLVVTAGSAFGQSPFVVPEQLNVASVLPMSPTDNSQQTKKELDLLHSLEKTRSAADIARAQADDAQEDIFIYRGVLGFDFSRENLPRTAA